MAKDNVDEGGMPKEKKEKVGAALCKQINQSQPEKVENVFNNELQNIGSSHSNDHQSILT